ncbi:4873_t:CDS:2 [Scutellospora calospora]|uniref:4873_t:CDS:1 n=1 Tax=Scutellospora calospora TaxID=85575 RepID=A0ACA9KLK3_9GLOM|nr:4873_t:CDS:2 [Scutellospora calospora]
MFIINVANNPKNNILDKNNYQTQIHGKNPQYLRIYESIYWKESCFGLTAVVLTSFDGQYGNQKPTEFLCLTLKLLQSQPNKEIIIEFKNEKYLRALGARLVGTSLDIYQYLEPLLNDYRKLRKRTINGGFAITHMDELIDELLREDRVCDTIMPRIIKRYVLEENGDLQPRESAPKDLLDEKEDNDTNSDRWYDRYEPNYRSNRKHSIREKEYSSSHRHSHRLKSSTSNSQ